MKLKFTTNSNGKKQYTLRDEINSEKTKPAHYKFIRIRDAPKGPLPEHKKRFGKKKN